MTATPTTNDGCKNDCTYNNCGDGYPNYNLYGAYGYGREDCDDGNYSYGDGCTPNCCCRCRRAYRDGSARSRSPRL